MQRLSQVRQLLRRRRHAAERARSQHLAAQQIVRALDGEAFVLEHRQDLAQQGVVALGRRRDDAGQQGRPLKVGLQRLEIRPVDVARQADRAAALGAYRLQDLADLGHAEVLPRPAVQVGVGETLQTDDEDLAPLGLAALSDADGQVARTRDQGQLRHSAPGRHSGRLPPSRMKAVISMISGRSA
ncbi:hypothetical protein D3C80_1378010 [compost metagenome]